MISSRTRSTHQHLRERDVRLWSVLVGEIVRTRRGASLVEAIERQRPVAVDARAIRYALFVAQVAPHQTASILPQLVARIVDVLQPVQVWLFGSRARGEARTDSDWDFMAVLPDNAPDQDLDMSSVWQRLRDLRLQRVDVFTMTRHDFDEWNRSLGTLAEIVASTGVVVYDG